MPALQPIREIEDVTPETFRNEIVPGYAPVVIRDLAKDWPAVVAGRESVDTLCTYLARFDRGAAAEAFVGPASIRGRFFYSDDLTGFNFERRRGSFAALLDHLRALPKDGDVPAVYAGALDMARTLPGFAEANPLPLVDGLGATPRIWVGNASTISTHFDASDNVACVTAGRRRFTLFPPDQVPNLYVGPLDNTMAGQPASMVDLHRPDFGRYPRFRQALDAAQTAELGPGDAIYIPALWWHQVDALDGFNVLVNFWWNDSPDTSARFDSMVHAVLTVSHLPSARRQAWSAMFDTFVFKRHGEPAEHLPPEHRSVLGKLTPRLRDYIRGYLLRGLQRP